MLQVRISNFLIAGLLMAQVSMEVALASERRPEDYCIVPVETGPAGGSNVSFRTTGTIAYVPEHPTPLFLGAGARKYFDKDGFLRPIRSYWPNYLSRFFQGKNGNVFTKVSGREAGSKVFDRGIGAFRAIDPDETELLQEAEELWENNKNFAQYTDNPAYIHWPTQPATNVDVDISEVPGAWRVGRRAEIVPLSDPEEALIKTADTVFWLKRRDSENPDACGTLEPPPEIAAHMWVPDGAENLTPPVSTGGYWPIRNGASVLIHAHGRLYELRKDARLYPIKDVPQLGFSTSYKVPGSNAIVINGYNSFLVFEEGNVSFVSESLIRHNCCIDMRPLGYDPDTGALRFQEGWRLEADGTLIEGGAVWHYGPVPERHFEFLEFDPGGQPVRSNDGRAVFSPQGWVYDAACGQAFDCMIGTIASVAERNGVILVGAGNGLFRFKPETMKLDRVAPNTILGSIRNVQFASWYNLFLIESAYGYFGWSDEQGFRRITLEDQETIRDKLFVVPEAERIIVNGYPPRVLEFRE